MEQYIIAAIITIIIGFFSVYGLTPIIIKALEKRNVTVIDVNKKEKTLVARPGGLSIIVGIISSLTVLYFFFSNCRNISYNNSNRSSVFGWYN